MENIFASNNNCTYEELFLWQKNHILPYPSYITHEIYTVSSFFGEHTIKEIYKWYPEGLSEWLHQIREIKYDAVKAKQLFIQRYITTLNELKELRIEDPLYDDIVYRDKLLDEEWGHFLNETYGVCTKKSTPEQIAIKEVCIRVIDRITEKQQAKIISETELAILFKSVNMLDDVSSMFAPHERKNNSRKRCIDLVRHKYLK